MSSTALTEFAPDRCRENANCCKMQIVRVDAELRHVPGCGERSADWKSAIQQTGSLRYRGGDTVPTSGALDGYRTFDHFAVHVAIRLLAGLLLFEQLLVSAKGE